MSVSVSYLIELFVISFVFLIYRRLLTIFDTIDHNILITRSMHRLGLVFTGLS